MYTPKKHVKKVSITEFNGSIRLVLPQSWNDSYQIGFLCGLPYTADGISKAKLIARQIEFDHEKGQLKPLEKYKYRDKKVICITTKTPVLLNLRDLWLEYTEFRSTQVEETTLRTNYRRVLGHIEKNPYQSLEYAKEMADYLITNNSVYCAKRILTQWSACLEWATNFNKNIKTNLFKGLVEKLNDPKAKASNDEENFDNIDPFSMDEIKVIIEAFEQHLIYSCYAPFVRFLVLTGCRISEAIGLCWQDINDDCSEIIFRRAVVRANGKKCIKGLKNGQAFRKFPCGKKLQSLLLTLKTSANVNNESPIFTAPKGGMINIRTFNSIWHGHTNKGKYYEGVVMQLAESKAIDHYRPQYQTRHTFITEMLRAGVMVKDVAIVVGNSPEIIYKHYAGANKNLELPDILL